MHPFLLLVSFNAFAQPAHPWLITATFWWEKILIFSGPSFPIVEGISSLLVAQKLAQEGKRLVFDKEILQFPVLFATAACYVLSGFWIVMARPPDHLPLLATDLAEI
jgi:hypothetical protein